MIAGPDDEGAGNSMYSLISDLYPFCRSITGDGVRQTLARLGSEIPLTVHEVPSGTRVLDWIVPPEWNIVDAFVADSEGRRVIDFTSSNLHVVSYSIPIDRWMTLDQLRPHLHTLPDRPDLIPYRTSYYDRSWGFCLSQRQLDGLRPGDYHVVIDSSLQPGSLTYGELIVPGESDEEILVSTHVCHPSLCDDNLSGIAVASQVARRLLEGTGPRLTHRFVFAPGTIGAITWLAQHRDITPQIVAGLTLTCLGDSQPFTYKRTFDGRSLIDRAAEQVLRERNGNDAVIEFFPYGYDERQYNSPGFRIPVGSLMRARHGQFAEYHTSADDLGFVRPDRLHESCTVLGDILFVLDRNRTLVNLHPYGEPQLGERGLYNAIGGVDLPDAQLAMLWLLSMSDGEHSLLDVAGRSGIAFRVLEATATLLEAHELLERADSSFPSTVEDVPRWRSDEV